MIYETIFDLKPMMGSVIAKKEPSNVFGRFFNTITLGSLTKEEEQQTYTALSILQDFNRVFRDLGINDVISLTKDGEVCFFDDANVEDDMEEAMHAFAKTLTLENARLFQSLHISLSHRADGLRYFIDLHIRRTHPLNESPIVLKIYALMDEFGLRKDEGEEELIERMSNSFSAGAYQDIVNKYRVICEQFTDDLETKIANKLQIQTTNKVTRRSVMRKNKGDTLATLRADKKSHPVMGNAYQTDTSWIWYLLFWSSVMDVNSVAAEDFDVIDTEGNSLHHFGEETTINDLAVFDESVATSSLSADQMTMSTDDLATSETSWLSDYGSADSGGDSGSSCGSSCGGGCGGE